MWYPPDTQGKNETFLVSIMLFLKALRCFMMSRKVHSSYTRKQKARFFYNLRKIAISIIVVLHARQCHCLGGGTSWWVFLSIFRKVHSKLLCKLRGKTSRKFPPKHFLTYPTRVLCWNCHPKTKCVFHIVWEEKPCTHSFVDQSMIAKCS